MVMLKGISLVLCGNLLLAGAAKAWFWTVPSSQNMWPARDCCGQPTVPEQGVM